MKFHYKLVEIPQKITENREKFHHITGAFYHPPGLIVDETRLRTKIVQNV